MGWPAIQGYANGDEVVADVLNKPIGQLTERTEYLKRLIEMNDRTKVVVSATVAKPTGTSDVDYPQVGQPVYRIPGSGAYAAAAAVVGENEWFYADPQAMAVGIVGASDATSETSASVVLYGFIDFGGDGSKATDGIDASTVIVDENPESGRYYLSTTYGKLTAAPSGPVIYVCDCRVAEVNGTYRVLSMLVNPQYRDTGESHIHRSFIISGMPMGGYAVKTAATGEDKRYHSPNVVDIATVRSATALPTGMRLVLCGAWTYDGVDSISYTLNLVQRVGTAGSAWADYDLTWSTTSSHDTSGSSVASITAPVAVGGHGLYVKIIVPSGATPSSYTGLTWNVTMPDDARAWVDYTYTDASTTRYGYRLNLGMYPVMARFVPPLPENGASMTVEGLDMRGVIFDVSKREWMVMPADAEGGPWLVWFGGEVNASNETAPFKWASGTSSTTLANATPRNIVLHVNRMRVGPTGFVTSLQPASGSPIRITAANTDTDAVQGALQIALDVDFKTSDDDVSGSKVVKLVEGSTFKTGPVVEKIIAGPGVSVSPSGGQGTVTVAVSNAVYAGDFETIALKNAKQDLAGGVFPYTKLLGWKQGVTNVASGFTAKFRVPDHIPYNANGYKVIVSASVFGESASTSAASAAFKLTNYTLGDYACSPTMPTELPEYIGQISNPVVGKAAVIPVSFAAGYNQFDPILIHGFPTSDVPDLTQRQHKDDLLLKTVTPESDIIVYPGYFVGLNIERCDLVGSATWYTGAIGFMSLRWNLVAVE